MKAKMVFAVLIALSFLAITPLIAQPAGGGWAKNVALLGKQGFGGFGSDLLSTTFLEKK